MCMLGAIAAAKILSLSSDQVKNYSDIVAANVNEIRNAIREDQTCQANLKYFGGPVL